MKLKREFYQRDTLKVAQDLLGKFIVHQYRGKKIAAMITEVEAYKGEDDLASHASKGRTPRTEVMYGQAGHIYVYLIYGMYDMLNFVTEDKNYPAAVLIRGVEDIKGPGKVSKFLKISKSHNKLDLTKNKIWVEDRGAKIKASQIKKAKRVGVDYAQHCKNWPWRFILKK